LVARRSARAGVEFVARNRRGSAGDIDLGGRRGRLLVVCGVRPGQRTLRPGGRGGDPGHAAPPAQSGRRVLGRRAGSRAAGHLVRFDVATVTPAGLEVIEAAC
jgi:Holliday junction resolvase-like predicted endonuclease